MNNLYEVRFLIRNTTLGTTVDSKLYVPASRVDDALEFAAMYVDHLNKFEGDYKLEAKFLSVHLVPDMHIIDPYSPIYNNSRHLIKEAYMPNVAVS
jgi:hypothetical protein